ncbi:hypothetical protein [Cupriavidus sp. USMAA2-4]|uniref:hypothetical protein n=1 Tax=Cupriavidus sp. USMAA2-4 TaxID=876364 RepID=UPI001E5E90B2|nr:hypothetical protein [Cupriavidus sp. USMAA2-4]
MTSDVYGGFASWIESADTAHAPGAQPIYVGRVTWPGTTEAEDTVIKLYPASSCGVANEVIGYIANAKRGIPQPPRGGIILLPEATLPAFALDVAKYVDKKSGFAVCWATSLVQNAKPFKFYRRLVAFDRTRLNAFLKSNFCHTLTGLDHITGNNDRSDANFMCVDDLKYLAIDQGSIGGSDHWHINWVDDNPKNQLLALARDELAVSQYAAWQAHALSESNTTRDLWPQTNSELQTNLKPLLKADQIATILEYMSGRATITTLAQATGQLF